MKTKGMLLCCMAVCLAACGAGRIELNDGWMFTREESMGPLRQFTMPLMLAMLDDQRRDLIDITEPSIFPVGTKPGSEHPYLRPKFQPKGWESTRVPHDAGIEFSFAYDLAPLDGYLPGTGVVWYRLKLKVEGDKLTVIGGDRELKLEKGGHLFFDCDGAMAFPMLWLNGEFAGGWPNGYMPWRVELTPFLKQGENVISVRTFRPTDFARWHTGVGLTRRCYLEAMPANHVVLDSVAITSAVSNNVATVKVAYTMSRTGKKEKTFTIENPRLWDVNDPYLYEIDIEGTKHRYGIRTIEWTVKDGFHLNGRRVQLNGFCFHQDLCSLGSVANRTAIRRRLEKAKTLGMNAIRMSHYPHAKDWYELCDEMGIMVMDELTDAWGQAKLANDYHMMFPRWHERDLRTMIRRHRNHPSVIIWSLGNEIWESRHGRAHWPLYQKNGLEMVRIAHQEDPTRPTTTANDNQSVWRSPLAHFQDVWGFNYRPDNYDEFKVLWPDRPVVGTETMCTQSSRGEYTFDFIGQQDGQWGLPPPGRKYIDYHSTSYGLHTDKPADYEWMKQDANPNIAGSFSWTAFDYFGSPMIMIQRSTKPIYSDPVRQAEALEELRRYGRVHGGIHSCATGVFDLGGHIKDEAYLYQSRWASEKPLAHILPHWNWPGREGKVTPVYVYSSGDEVELFVNGVSQGRKGREKGLWRFRFNDVVYQPGEVKAVAYKNGNKWAEETMKTVGTPAKLVAMPERAEIASDGEDVGYVTLKVVDKDGNFCPTAKLHTRVTVEGAGEFVSIENGDETDFTWLRDPSRKTFNGLLTALVRAKKGATGEIKVTFTVDGLPCASARIIACPSIGTCATTPLDEKVQTAVNKNVSSGHGAKPLCVSGVYPHLAMRNNEGECGTGAVVPWAGSLWAVTYAPHAPTGSSDKLYEIKDDLTQVVRRESVGGTPANRIIHRETHKLLIGQYVIDANGAVTTVPISKMPGRLTGAARSITDPARKVYVADMEEALYELDMTNPTNTFTHIRDGHNSSAFNAYFKKWNRNPPPGWKDAQESTLFGYHGKGTCSGFGKVFYANNGQHSQEAMRNPRTPSGCLAFWKPGMKNWELIRTNQFTEVTTRDGIYGNEHPLKNPIWALGWDYRSIILTTTMDGEKWHDYRLPKGSHSYDGAHGWNTEWPRIREIGEGDEFLATMHGTFWKFPATFGPGSAARLRPRSTYLKVIGDFARWGRRVVFGCDDHAKSEFLNTRALKGKRAQARQSESNLWFVEPERLDALGPREGRGAVWSGDTVKRGETSDAFLFAGYDRKWLWLTVSAELQIDARGDGDWITWKVLPCGGHNLTDAPIGEWVRLVACEDANNVFAVFHYTSERGSATTVQQCFAQKAPEEASSIFENDALIPQGLITEDAASVIYADNGVRRRLPRRTAESAATSGRLCREVSTERDLLHTGEIFYELPADNAGGFKYVHPVAATARKVCDYDTWKGCLVLKENVGNATNLVIGVADDLWNLGKPVGVGGPWKDTVVAANEPSDAYLMNGFDRKSLTLRTSVDAKVTLEADIDGCGTWVKVDEYCTSKNEVRTIELQRAFSAYWVRVRCDKPCAATAQFVYQ